MRTKEKRADAAEMFEEGSLTIEGLKRDYGIGRTTAYELMNSGKLPFTQPYGRRLIPRRAVMELLAAGMTGGEK